MCPRPRHRRSFWLVLIGTTAFLTIDPALFLVVVALGLSGLALVWTLMLAQLLLIDTLGGHASPVEDGRSVCPFAAWRADGVSVSSSARPPSSARGASS